MKNIGFIVFSCFVLFSCKEKKAEIQLPVEKLYLVEYRQYFPDESELSETEETPLPFFVKGIAEVDHDFNLKITRADGWVGSKYSWDKYILSDSTKTKISHIIEAYPNDTSFSKGEEAIIYDGNFYFLYIEKGDEKHTFIDLYIPWKIDNEDFKYVYNKLYGRYEDRALENSILNQDSVKLRFLDFIKYLPDSLIQGPLPPRKATVKFIPPVIKDEGYY